MIAQYRIPFMLLALVNLLAGLAAGLVRMGYQFLFNTLAPAHGAIMVGGFLGTLIALEKIIPLKNKFLLIIPLLSSGSLLLFFFGLSQEAVLCITTASFCLTGVFLYYFFRHRNIQYTLMLAGGICWSIGNVLLYSKNFYPACFPMWLAFILFIIVGERIELMKFLPVTNRDRLILFVLVLIYIISTLFQFHGTGNIIAGISLVGISTWLLKYDVIAVGISKSHLTKYVAIALMCGYTSLLVCGIFLIIIRESMLAYDTIVHTFFLGFAFSMIFAHGPIILPGVLGIAVKPFHKIFYLFLFLLQVSWLIRAYADGALNFQLRQISGALSVIAILGYFISLIVVLQTNRRGEAL